MRLPHSAVLYKFCTSVGRVQDASYFVLFYYLFEGVDGVKERKLWLR